VSFDKFEFTDNVMYLKGVGPRRAAALEKLNIFTKYDLLTHYPHQDKYENFINVTKIRDILADEKAVLFGKVSNITFRKSFVRNRSTPIINAWLSDDTGYIQVTWFNQEYLLNKLKEGMIISITGKATFDKMGRLSISPKGFTEEPELGIMPVYPSTEAITQKAFRNMMKNLLAQMPPLTEILPPEILREQNFISRDEAIRAIHFPKNFAQLDAARRRLAFEELFLIQCELMSIKRQTQDERLGISHKENGELVKAALEKLPFDLTNDQKKVFREVVKDMESKLPMRRLIQGDVGSGKTAVALLALVKTVENGFQGAFMAPTEILATQHYEKFSTLLTDLGIRVGLLSAKVTRSKRAKEELYQKISAHELDIVIGTHALIQEGVQFAKLGLVVTDEQHRFGVNQRSTLEKKSDTLPDMLVMTATPIPRTMKLTVYGDLDVSTIKELPPGRKPIKTMAKSIRSRKKVYDFVRTEILSGRQAYVVCPLIERSESEMLADIEPAEEIFDMLSNGIFSDVPCALLHGKMKPNDKETIMEKFHSGETKLLVSTTVIEVGVDVPNASVMVVEHAERFGLAQLHQLRGRVGRGAEKSYCILISDSKAEVARERLKTMESTNDGFKLAEVDLKLRGPGQFFGEAQHGLPDLKIANVFDEELLIQARDAAEKFINDDENSIYLPKIKRVIDFTYGDKFSQIIAS